MRWLTSRIMVAAVCLGACALGAGVFVEARVLVEKSVPVNGAIVALPPSYIEIWFTEVVDLKVSAMALAGPSGAVKLDPTHKMSPKTLMAGISDKLADGTYTVNWQTAGDDGRVVKGVLKFSVKSK